MEQWKDIIGYEGYYKISNYGNIISSERAIIYSNGVLTKYKEKKRIPSLSEYRMISLSKNGQTKLYKIARLVALHFIPIEDNRCIVNHKDYNKHNDMADNLEWVTYSENSIHSNNRSLKRKGIFYDKKRKKWCAYIYRGNKNIFIGRFNTEIDAINNQEDKLKLYDKNKY